LQPPGGKSLSSPPRSAIDAATSLWNVSHRARRANSLDGASTMEFGICFDTHIDKWDLIRYV